MWTLEGVRAHISPLHLIRKALCWYEGGVEGKGVGEWGSGGVGEAGDSRLLACVVFPLRDLYTDAVGINFWWTIGTASSPLALSSHPISPHSLSPSLSFSYRLFPPTYVSSLSYMLLFFLLLWSICLASWNFSIFVKVAQRGWGIWDEPLLFDFRVCFFWRLSRYFNLNQPQCTVCRLSNKTCCVCVCFSLHVTPAQSVKHCNCILHCTVLALVATLSNLMKYLRSWCFDRWCKW